MIDEYMTPEMAELFKHAHRRPAKALRVVDAAVMVTAVPLSAMASKAQGREVTYARHLTWFALAEHARTGANEIGRMFGGRDHSTVLQGIRRIEMERRTRPSTQRDVDRIAAAMGAKQ